MYNAVKSSAFVSKYGPKRDDKSWHSPTPAEHSYCMNAMREIMNIRHRTSLILTIIALVLVSVPVVIEASSLLSALPHYTVAFSYVIYELIIETFFIGFYSYLNRTDGFKFNVILLMLLFLSQLLMMCLTAAIFYNSIHAIFFVAFAFIELVMHFTFGSDLQFTSKIKNKKYQIICATVFLRGEERIGASSSNSAYYVYYIVVSSNEQPATKLYITKKQYDTISTGYEGYLIALNGNDHSDVSKLTFL